MARDSGKAANDGHDGAALGVTAAKPSDAVFVAATRLRQRFGAARVREGLSLAALGRWRIGGPADLDLVVRDKGEAADAIRMLAQLGVPYVVVGHGSNLLFDDAGLRGVVLRLGGGLADMTIGSDGTVTAGAALWVPRFVREVMRAGCAGATHAIGIPGSLGGLVAMNGGSSRQNIGQYLLQVEAVNAAGRSCSLQGPALRLGYRTSALVVDGLTMLSARFLFPAGDPEALRRDALAILTSRRRRFPSNRANCGSVFVSDPQLYATLGPPGRAIEQAGLKGARAGEAEIATEHANFIVNRGAARTTDVLTLIALARRRVWEETGVAMKAEVQHVAADGRVRPAHEAAAELSS